MTYCARFNFVLFHFFLPFSLFSLVLSYAESRSSEFGSQSAGKRKRKRALRADLKGRGLIQLDHSTSRYPLAGGLITVIISHFLHSMFSLIKYWVPSKNFASEISPLLLPFCLKSTSIRYTH